MAFILRDAEKIICAIIFLAMTLLGFANVVVRYASNYSLAASEELLTNGFLLLTIFGAAIAARTGDHLAVTLIYELVPRAVRKLMLVIACALSILLLAASAWFTFELLSNQVSSGVRSYALQIPAWYYSVGLPFAFALVIVRYIQRALDEWRDLHREAGSNA
ncbi:C4-dicarboxylate ABC transporter permease [Pseudorhizobium halotolerans]|uniref:TRAP transporter small permease protein n=1 Tax=Pseudorhizobium halotolerans TaxID=1233081 RepID=A0ABM8PV77_9HYPH|nr:TRAP transporter small permease [Pseudorhizobium halotolerans]CAD6595578.1 TRAP transporter small permease [Rhizobium sp. Khangiran2]CAD7050210.1 C4-dicarboxylate ABC transporter permease [Pseudorhizobium halotolerans]